MYMILELTGFGINYKMVCNAASKTFIIVGRKNCTPLPDRLSVKFSFQYMGFECFNVCMFNTVNFCIIRIKPINKLTV